MRKIIIISIFFVITILFHAAHAAAADRYVRAGATGNDSGSDWANAYTSLPAALVRGDTYYIADGTYPSYTVDDAVSGALYITIKKATISDHGTNTGWNDSYGDGQAIFSDANLSDFETRISIITSYVIFDGVVGSGADPNSYGFKVATPTNCNQNNDLVGFPPTGYYSSLDISNVTISHVAAINCGIDYNIGQRTFYSNPKSASNITVSNNYLSNGNTNLLIRNWSNSAISDNYFDGNWENTGNSGQQISPAYSSDITLARNIFKNTHSFIVGGHQNNNQRWKIYNNIAIGYSGSFLAGGYGSAVINNVPDDNVVINWEIHHNTFVNIKFGSYGPAPIGPLTDASSQKSAFYNNLFYNCSNPRLTNPGCPDCYAEALVHTHNAHFNSTGTYDSSEGGTAQVGTGDPFVDSVNNDFHLKAPTDAGRTLSSPYDIDADGNPRGADGVWGRGAYEHCGSGNCSGDGDTGGNTGGSSSGGDSSASGGSGCGFVKDDGKGQKAKGEGLALMLMLIISLAGIAIARRLSYKFNRNL